MRWVTFSGGEPLLRKDIGELVRHCKGLGITTFISTNGTLLPRRIHEVDIVDRITISLDGGAEVHDAVRGEGSFAEAVAAVKLCRERGIATGLTCTLSKHNLHCVDEVLELTRSLETRCMFQPATLWLDSGTDPNPIAPDPEPYRATIDRLLAEKRKGAPIANSMAGLRLLRRWPEPVRIRSMGGSVTCTVEPDGKVLASHLLQTAVLEETREDGLRPWELYRKLPPIKHTDQPWCGPILELDLIFNLNLNAIRNAMQIQI
jgi:MoaA/NifB/PqqE/SkfB family radical SAM enzyme